MKLAPVPWWTSEWPIGHLRDAFCLCIKTSLSAKLFPWKCVSPTGSFSRKSSSFTYERVCTRTRFETEAQSTRNGLLRIKHNACQLLVMHKVMGVELRKRQPGNYKPQRRKNGSNWRRYRWITNKEIVTTTHLYGMLAYLGWSLFSVWAFRTVYC